MMYIYWNPPAVSLDSEKMLIRILECFGNKILPLAKRTPGDLEET